MTLPIIRVTEGETPLEESLRLETTHFRQQSSWPIEEPGLVQALVVLNKRSTSHNRFDRDIGILINETKQTSILIWIGSIIGTVAHLAISESELDNLPLRNLPEALVAMSEENPELAHAVTELLATKNHSRKIVRTAGSGKSDRGKAVFRQGQLAPQSFGSTVIAKSIKVEIPSKKKHPIPLTKTIGKDGVSF